MSCCKLQLHAAGLLQADSESCYIVSASLDACLAALRVLTAPGLSRKVMNEDAIEAILSFLRTHTLLNVLVFYDGRLRQLHRPALNEQGMHPAEIFVSDGHTILAHHPMHVKPRENPVMQTGAAGAFTRLQTASQLLLSHVACGRIRHTCASECQNVCARKGNPLGIHAEFEGTCLRSAASGVVKRSPNAQIPRGVEDCRAVSSSSTQAGLPPHRNMATWRSNLADSSWFEACSRRRYERVLDRHQIVGHAYHLVPGNK